MGLREVKVDRDFLASLLGKLPPTPFERAGQYRGQADGYQLVAIDPKGRKLVLGCTVAGEFDESAVVSGLSGRGKPAAATPAKPGASWKKFRFEVRVSVNIEVGPDGGPRFRVDVDDIKRKELDGLAGSLAKVMGRGFDRVVTAFADQKAASIDDKLNGEVAKKVELFKQYGMLCGVDYFADHLVLLFDQSRFRPEGTIGHVYTEPRPGAIPLYRWLHIRKGDHFYTTDINEPDRRVYRLECVACYVLDGSFPGSVPSTDGTTSANACTPSPSPTPPYSATATAPPPSPATSFPPPPPAPFPFFSFSDPTTGLHFYSIHPNAEFAGTKAAAK